MSPSPRTEKWRRRCVLAQRGLKGKGEGEGFNINVPLAAGSGIDAYRKAFNERLKPAALKFKPDMVLISAGFDSRVDDPLGGLQLTDADFAELTQLLMDLAHRCAGGRLVSVLEGGYSLTGLADATESHVRTLSAADTE